MAKRPLRMPDRSEVTDDTPLRLAVAAALAYPDGSMTASGLRKERDAGRLVTELTAGKEFTTLADIGRMRELCRRKVEPSQSMHVRQGSVSPIREQGSIGAAAAMLSVERLKARVKAERRADREATQVAPRVQTGVDVPRKRARKSKS